jgi:predicted aldo/keto reductase-like oxidoreductase
VMGIAVEPLDGGGELNNPEQALVAVMMKMQMTRRRVEEYEK